MEMKPTLVSHQGIIVDYKKSDTHISFRLNNSELVFYLYEEDCVSVRYAKCLHWITQAYPVGTFCITAWVNESKPIGAVVDRIMPVSFNVYSFLFNSLCKDEHQA